MKVHVVLDYTEGAEREAIMRAIQQVGLKLDDEQVLLERLNILLGDLRKDLVEDIEKIPGVHAVWIF